MNIVCVTSGDYESLQDKLIDKDSLTIIAHGIIKQVNLIEELEGRSVTLKNLALWSKSRNLLIIAGIDAIVNQDTYCSAVVIDSGVILGISDMTHNLTDEYKQGNSLRLYDTSMGMIGLIIGDDIYYPENIRALCIKGAEFLVYIANKKSSRGAMISISSSSLLNGVYCLAQNIDKVTVFDCYGKMIIRSSEQILREIVNPETSKTLIESRREEVYRRVFIEGKND